MLLRLLLLFTLLPLADLILLVWIGRQVGVAPVLGLVVGTAVLGAVVARWRGLRAWRSFRAELAAGRVPANEAADGLLVLSAATLLVMPGPIADVLGGLLLVPPVRAAARTWLLVRVGRKIEARVRGFGRGTGGDVLDAEFRRADATAIEHRPSP